MTSPRPPRLRDTRSLVDRVRQDRQNLQQLGVGFVGGRFPPARPLGSAAYVGDIEDDEATDGDTDQIAFCNTDQVVASGPGTVTLPLTYEPIDGSLHVRWNTLDQPTTEWALSGQTVTIPDPTSTIAAGDVLTAAYAYHPSDGVADIGDLGIDWGSSGPNLTVTEDDLTDRSAPGYDDSTWTVAAGPVGYPLGPNGGEPTWNPVLVSTTSTNRGLWLRRTLTTSDDATLSISARVDGQWWVYCDGVVVASDPSGTGTGEVGPHLVAVAPGDHVIALHVNDDDIDPGGLAVDYIYGDLNVVVIQ